MGYAGICIILCRTGGEGVEVRELNLLLFIRLLMFLLLPLPFRFESTLFMGHFFSIPLPPSCCERSVVCC